MTAEKILIVEDDQAVARGLEYGLSKEGFKPFVARTGEAALEIVSKQKIDLILLDIRLPGISGFDVCRKLRAEGKNQPILILTALDEEIEKVVGLELGADDYVVKPYSLRELTARIRALLRRAYGEFSDEHKSEECIEFGEIIIDLNQLRVYRNGEPVNLTATEFRLLHFLASHPNRPFRREQLMEAVWGYSGTIGSDRTVDVHIRHLREKIEQDPAKPEWIITVRGLGYKFNVTKS